MFKHSTYASFKRKVCVTHVDLLLFHLQVSGELDVVAQVGMAYDNIEWVIASFVCRGGLPRENTVLQFDPIFTLIVDCNAWLILTA